MLENETIVRPERRCFSADERDEHPALRFEVSNFKLREKSNKHELDGDATAHCRNKHEIIVWKHDRHERVAENYQLESGSGSAKEVAADDSSPSLQMCATSARPPHEGAENLLVDATRKRKVK